MTDEALGAKAAAEAGNSCGGMVEEWCAVVVFKVKPRARVRVRVRVYDIWL